MVTLYVKVSSLNVSCTHKIWYVYCRREGGGGGGQIWDNRRKLCNCRFIYQKKIWGRHVTCMWGTGAALKIWLKSNGKKPLG
jgi:hypothetical protein